jgi:hypothetical protein
MNKNKNDEYQALLFLIKKHLATAFIILISISVFGCASMKSTVVEERYTISDTDLCQNLIADYEEIYQASQNPSEFSPEDLEYYQVLADEILRRNLDYSKCDELTANAFGKSVKKALVVTGVFILYALAAQGSNGGDYSYSDNDWDWDYQPGNNQWVCRGIQTGQYAALANCAYDQKDDDRWPN